MFQIHQSQHIQTVFERIYLSVPCCHLHKSLVSVGIKRDFLYTGWGGGALFFFYFLYISGLTLSIPRPFDALFTEWMCLETELCSAAASCCQMADCGLNSLSRGSARHLEPRQTTASQREGKRDPALAFPHISDI